MSQIGKNIKKIRNVRGLSQQAFADIFQLTRGNISSYEEFRAEPKIDVLMKIANYFSIPLSDFIEKELTVNALLHYNTQLVVEPDKLKVTQHLKEIPYIPTLYISDYTAQYTNDTFLQKLPHLIVPANSRFKLVAIEVDSQEDLPAGFRFKNGDILIWEQVVKENVHRIAGKLGLMADSEGLKWGVYEEKEHTLRLSLNEWIEYPFDMDSSQAMYWVLKASYTQE